MKRRVCKHPLFSFLQGVSAALFFLKNPGFCGQMKVFPALYLRGKERRASTASEYPLAIFGFREPSLKPKNARWEHPKPCYEKRRDTTMANRKRNIQVKFYVTAEEKELMEQKMAQLQTKRIGAYLRKMAIDGYIIYVDTKDIKEMNKLLSAIGRNINQIAKRVNAGGPTYQADMEEIRERLDQIWQLQRRILLSQR